ncbi:MAG: hypothetical protein GX889_10050 [Clostridiales bacterium]|nr:hypothetical protein [Clostridiales bacterium]
MKKFIGITIIVLFFLGNTLPAFAVTGQAKDNSVIQNNFKEESEYIIDSTQNINLDYGIRACMGQRSWRDFTIDVLWEVAGLFPGSKIWAAYDKVYLVVSKAYQIGNNDWESLCWTVIDVISAFVPGATPVKLFWSLCKLTPNF